MFVNDVFGLCRSNFLTGDVFGGQFAQTPFGYNFGTSNITGQGYHPLYGYLVNRVPTQGFFHQGVNPHVFGNVNPLGVNSLGVNTLGTQPFLPISAFTNPVLAHQGGFNTIGYGFSPYTVGNWNWTSPLGGLQTQICR